MKNLKNKITQSLGLTYLIFGLGACAQQSFEEKVDLASDQNMYSSSYTQEALKKKVDLLVVVDNSRSMRADQDKLSREFSSFVSHLDDADYRIGVITTDTSSKGYESTPGYWGNLDFIVETGNNFITKEDSNPARLFSNLINRKETASCDNNQNPENCASFDERPLYAIKMAIDKRKGVNYGFFREDADLGVVIIADEDETPFEDGSVYTADDLLKHIEKEFSGKKKTLGFTIAIQDNDEACFEEQAKDTVTGAKAVSYGVRIGELAELTEGFKVSICNQNFGEDLKQISSYVKKELLPFRKRLPSSVDIDSINLKITKPDGKPFDFKAEVVGGELRVYPTPPEGSFVSISYDY